MTAILGDLPGPLPDVLDAGQVLMWDGTAWVLNGGVDLAIELDDLADVDGTTGTGSTVVLSAGPTLTAPRINSINDTAGLKIIQFAAIASAVRYLEVQNADAGGSVAITATDGALSVPLAIFADSLALILNVAAVQINGNTIETQNNKAAASGYASLSASTLVVQNPANATATPTASKIPIADGSGKLNGWVNGRWLLNTVKTSGTTHTTGASTTTIRVFGRAGGAGGGGAAQAALSAAAGGGGGQGGWFEKWFTVTPSTAYTCSVGTGGAGGTAGANDGTSGVDTTFVVGATTATAKGGGGGKGSAAGTALSLANGGSGGAISTNGDLNGAGSPGSVGFTVSGTAGNSGNGGGEGGGIGVNTERAGIAGIGYGSGGSGGLCLGTTARAGAAGSAGVLFITEYS